MYRVACLCGPTLSVCFALVGCFGLFKPDPPIQTLTGISSPLDRDLRIAVQEANREFASHGWEIRIRWASISGSSYVVERSLDGTPLRQSVRILYAFHYPSRSKCYLSPDADGSRYEVRLAREHLGGGRYGTPRVIGMTPMAGDKPIGSEVLCSAVENATAGIRESG